MEKLKRNQLFNSVQILLKDEIIRVLDAGGDPKVILDLNDEINQYFEEKNISYLYDGIEIANAKITIDKVEYEQMIEFLKNDKMISNHILFKK